MIFQRSGVQVMGGLIFKKKKKFI